MWRLSRVQHFPVATAKVNAVYALLEIEICLFNIQNIIQFTQSLLKIMINYSFPYSKTCFSLFLFLWVYVTVTKIILRSIQT